MKTNPTIGTRGSLLAKTQTEQTQIELQNKTGLKFDIKFIETEGDQKTNQPLWQLEGKDFFTKELDQELLAKKIDLTISSYKDLGSERPKGIHLGAITKRTYPHDILLIKKSVIKELSKKTELIIGTSSPRRGINLEASLSYYIPGRPTIKCKTLRGNINTRIEKLLENQFDAIVLALAGLERLAQTESSRKELERLVKDLNFMVLPTSKFPPAASQGALGVECREDDHEMRKSLAKIHDPETEEIVKRERKAFHEYGGGCHLAVGVHVKKVPHGYLHIHRGEVDNKLIEFTQFERTTPLPKLSNPVPFLGMPENKNTTDYLCDQLITKEPIRKELITDHILYVSSNYTTHVLDNCKENVLFAAGDKTFRTLSRKDFWVNGSADSFGEDEILSLTSSKALNCFYDETDLSILTHKQAKTKIEKPIIVYNHVIAPVTEKFKKRIQECNIFYWTSYSQYQTYELLFPEIRDKIHCCGMGKTFQSLSEEGIKTYPFYKMNDFIAWINKELTNDNTP